MTFHDVSYVTQITDDIHCVWQAQYLVKFEGASCCSANIVNDVSYVKPINHEILFAWQAQYLVKLDGASCCSAHCT